MISAGDGITLREWRRSDARDLARLANDRRIASNLRDAFPHPYAIDDARRFIAHAQAMKPQTYYAIVHRGHLAGGVGYTLHEDVERCAAEVGYWLGVDFWDRGIASRAVIALSRFAFARHLELTRLYALPFATNRASARVLEKAGYRREARMRRAVVKNGVVLDQWLYALLRDEL